MKKIAILMALALASFSLAANRVGPVSQYGQLQAGVSAGKGQIFGSCPTYNNTPVQVRGMSLYWSLHPNATEFYNETSIGIMVSDMHIEMIRIPVGTSEGSWGNGAPGGYMNSPNDQKALIDAVVQAAVKYDIYVIIDWHSHTANKQVNETNGPRDFFEYVAQTYGKLDNVIFEIFNEPVCANGAQNESGDPCSGKGGYMEWSGIKSYAEDIIPIIRQYSDNLILVGTPQWDQYPGQVVNNAIDDDNVAYTFHYYANTHTVGNQGNSAETAMNNGLSVFVSEWGTANANGNGTPNETANDSWQTWMNTHMLSSANWSASRIDEGTAAFDRSSEYDNISYTRSGEIVKAIFAGNPTSYTKCSTDPNSSSSTNSSASEDAVVIDDFEDGNTTAEALGEAYWYLYEAGGTVSNETILNDEGDEVWDIIRSSGSNTYAAMEGIAGIEFGDDTYPSVGMGMDIPEAAFENCTAIQYDYKGSGHKFRAAISTIEPDLGYEHVTGNQNKSTTWKTVVVTAKVLSQPAWVEENSPENKKDFSWALVNKVAWIVDEKIPNAQLGDELQIDNVQCVGVLPEVSSSSSDENSSSSVKPSSSSVKPSSSSVAPSSSSAAPALVLIDDLEDGNTGIEIYGDDGYWFLYTANGGSVSNTQKSGVWDMVRGNTTNYYAAMLGISGITEGDKDYPSVGMAINIPETNLEECSAIQYDYRGSGHMFRAAMSAVTADKGYEHVTKAKAKATGWTTVTVKTAELKQPTWIPATEKKDFSWADVYQIAWVVDEKISDDERGTTLEVDNVYCVPQTEESSSSSVISSSADAECEEGDELHVGTSNLKCIDGKWVDMNSSSSTSSSSSGNSSSSANPGFALIDDFQDENTQSESLGAAYWYIYKAGGSVTNKQDAKTQSWDMVRIDGTNAYVAMEGISGITYNATTYPSVGMGVDIPASAFANCTAISYEYRGSAHMFRAGMSTVTADKGYEHITGIQPKATTWTPVTVTAADLKQPTWIPATEKQTFSWAKVSKLAWVVDEKIKDADRGTNLDIDNVKCIGSLPAAKSSSSSVKPNSSASVNPGSSSATGVKPGSSSGTNNGGANNNGTNNGTNNGNNNGYGTAIGDIASPAGLDASIMGNTLVVSVARAGLVKVQVFDMMGHSIESHSESMAAGSFAHDFAKLNKGAYIVRVRQGSMVKTLRMQVR